VIKRLTPFAAVAILGLVSPFAPAQLGGGMHNLDDLISRPSTRGASSLLGGRYTSARDVEQLLTTRRNVGLMQDDQMTYFRSTRASSRGRVLPTTQLGVFDVMAPPRGNPLSLMPQRSESLTIVSGLSGATDFRLPLAGRREDDVPALAASAYTPQPARTRFQTYFGLHPVERPAQTATFTSYPDALDSQTDARVRQMVADGIALFRKATIEQRDRQTNRYPTCTDCASLLDDAVRKLRQARNLDSPSELPTLLMLHAALEQDRPTLAIVHLVDAFRKNPEVFTLPQERLNACFGDSEEGQKPSEVLAAQMRRYAHIGDLNPNSVDSQLLQAYCAWRLGDETRVQAAAQAAALLLRDAPQSDMTAVQTSLAIALQGAQR